MESCISEKKLYRHGKIEKDEKGLRVFALSSVIPMELSPRLIKLDEIISKVSLNRSFVSLNFVIDGLDEELKFFFNLNDSDGFFYLKKIIFGEIRLKSKQCSEIFYYNNADSRSNVPKFCEMVGSYVCKFDKVYLFSFGVSENSINNMLYLISYNKCKSGRIIGFSSGQIQFFKKMVCPKSSYRVVDVYFRASNLDINDSGDIVFSGQTDF